MKNRNIENALSRSLHKIDKTSYEKIISAHRIKQSSHDAITYQEIKDERTDHRFCIMRRTAACFAAAAIIFMLVIGGFANQHLDTAPAVSIVIGENQDIEILSRKDGRVLKVCASSVAANALISGRDYTGMELDSSIKSLLGAMYTKKIITGNNDVILFSLTGESESDITRLADTLLKKTSVSLGNAGKNVLIAAQCFTLFAQNESLSAKRDNKERNACYAAYTATDGVSAQSELLVRNAVDAVQNGGNLFGIID